MNALEFHQPTRFIVASDGSILDRRREAFAPFSITLSAPLGQLDAAFIDGQEISDRDLEEFWSYASDEPITPDAMICAMAMGPIHGNSGMCGAL